ncbi:hypothetical protein PIB30_020313 [Stylosanthes scabra]|uniref:Uncharacterized protein n=1 Tax=Stylosanthes scabra TaxID=79078 RepID=A0ABU6W6U2_9FABA|nr:hypothetical protein [Stylosanthes scabra]
MPSPTDLRPLTVAISDDSSLLKLDRRLLGVVLCSNQIIACSSLFCSNRFAIYSFARRLESLAVSRLRSSLPLVVTAYRLCPIATFPLWNRIRPWENYYKRKEGRDCQLSDSTWDPLSISCPDNTLGPLPYETHATSSLMHAILLS